MPQYYTTTPRLGIRYAQDSGANKNVIEDFSLHVGATAVDIDSMVVGYLEGTHAARPAAGISNRIYRETDTGGYFFDTGSAWIQFGGTRQWNEIHAFTLDDQTGPNPTATILGSFPVYPATNETWALVGAIHKCSSIAGTASVFKIQYDHAAHGTLADVPGLTSITPAAGGYVFTPATGGPLALASLDEIALRLTTVGSSKGWKVAVVIAHSQ